MDNAKKNPELPKTLKGDASEQHKNPRPEPDQTELGAANTNPHIPLHPPVANPETHQQLPAKSISSSTSQTLLALQHQQTSGDPPPTLSPERDNCLAVDQSGMTNGTCSNAYCCILPYTYRDSLI